MNNQLYDLPTLLAALAFLMTRYGLYGSVEVAQGITNHLEMLLANAEVQQSPAARNTYELLLTQWRGIVHRHRVATRQTHCRAQRIH